MDKYEKYLTQLDNKLQNELSQYYLDTTKDSYLRKKLLPYIKLANMLELRGNYTKGI